MKRINEDKTKTYNESWDEGAEWKDDSWQDEESWNEGYDSYWGKGNPYGKDKGKKASGALDSGKEKASSARAKVSATKERDMMPARISRRPKMLPPS